jgi:ankyrin repeat protein
MDVPIPRGDVVHWGGVLAALQTDTSDGKDETQWPPRASRLAAVLRELDECKTVVELCGRVRALSLTEEDINWLNSPLLDSLRQLFQCRSCGCKAGYCTPCQGTWRCVYGRVKHVGLASYLMRLDVQPRPDDLWRAAETNSPELVRLYVVEGRIDVRGKDGWDAVRAAIRSRNLSMIDVLVELGVSLQSDYGNALMNAVMCCSKDMISRLLERGCVLKGDLLHVAVMYRNTAMVRFLVGLGVDPKSKDGQNALETAFYNRDTAMVRQLVECGVDIKADRDAAICTAVASKMPVDMLAWLLDLGADVNARNGYPLVNAAYAQCDTATVQLLLDRGAIVDAHDGYALTHAIDRANMEHIRLLVDRGADVNLVTAGAGGFVWYPLRWAILKGQVAVMSFLWDRGARIHGGVGQSFVSLLDPVALQWLAERGLMSPEDVAKLVQTRP